MFHSKRLKTAIATLIIAAGVGHVMQYGFAAPAAVLKGGPMNAATAPVKADAGLSGHS